MLVFAAMFDQFKASLQNKSISFFKKYFFNFKKKSCWCQTNYKFGTN